MLRILRNNRGGFIFAVGAAWFFIDVVGTLAAQDYKKRHQDKIKIENKAEAKPIILG